MTDVNQTFSVQASKSKDAPTHFTIVVREHENLRAQTAFAARSESKQHYSMQEAREEIARKLLAKRDELQQQIEKIDREVANLRFLYREPEDVATVWEKNSETIASILAEGRRVEYGGIVLKTTPLPESSLLALQVTLNLREPIVQLFTPRIRNAVLKVIERAGLHVERANLASTLNWTVFVSVVEAPAAQLS